MEYGKFAGVNVVDNCVALQFEKQTVNVEIITDEIIRVFVPTWMKDYKSVAIEGDVAIPVDFDVTELDGEDKKVRISTSSVSLCIGDDFDFTFLDNNCLIYYCYILITYDFQQTYHCSHARCRGYCQP